MPPNLPDECIKCRKPCKVGRHYCEACHKQKYLCQLPKCNEPHYSAGLCRKHADVDEHTIITYEDGTPGGLEARLAYLAQRILDAGTELGEQVREQQQNRHEKS